MSKNLQLTYARALPTMYVKHCCGDLQRLTVAVPAACFLPVALLTPHPTQALLALQTMQALVATTGKHVRPHRALVLQSLIQRLGDHKVCRCSSGRTSNDLSTPNKTCSLAVDQSTESSTCEGRQMLERLAQALWQTGPQWGIR